MFQVRTRYYWLLWYSGYWLQKSTHTTVKQALLTYSFHMHYASLYKNLTITLLFILCASSKGFVPTIATKRSLVAYTTIHDDEGFEPNDFHPKDSDDMMAILSKRIKEVSDSQSFQEKLDQFYNQIIDDQTSLILDVPVICFDAILPNQVMEGSTSDSTFVSFLRELGLGGWFVMTSLDFKKRLVRRNGTLCKIEFIDMVHTSTNDRLPTAIDFVIRGKKRIRVLGEHSGMRMRIGRWRKSYDDNGEESVLGWGPERFLDAPLPTTTTTTTTTTTGSSSISSKVESTSLDDLPKCKWTWTGVECYHDDTSDVTDDLIRKAQSLIPLVKEWCDLASDMKTYENSKVTATTRVQQGQPFMSVQPDILLERVKRDLGEMPQLNHQGSIYDFVFWVAALINPLPCLGVSLEIRGKLLEAYSLEEKLTILEFGLQRSLQNLRGERPL